MVKVTSNISVIIKAKLEEIKALQNNPDKILRTVAMAVLPKMKKRVHIEGKDSSGNQIGTYSPGYMKVRTGNFKNSSRVSRGKDKGKLKDAGYKSKQRVDTPFGKGRYAYQNIEDEKIERPRYNRTNDTKVILSLTRQMENDLNIIPSGNGYGIGYLNPENRKKADYVEATYKKKILTKLTKEEVDLAKETAQGFTNEYLKNNNITPEQYLGV